MTQNVLTSSTSSTSSGTRSAWPDRTSSRTPSPPLGGGLRDEVGAAGRLGGSTSSTGTRCVACTAKHHLALAREALQRGAETTRRPA